MQLFKKIAVGLLFGLRHTLHVFFGFGPCCRFQPTCSQYFELAIDQEGVARGTFLGLQRILKCHPWGSWGYDPLRKREVF